MAIFALRSTPKLWESVHTLRLIQPSPNASLDRLLAPLLRVSKPSERLAQAFAQLPKGSAILFVSRKGDERWDFIYSAVCYLTWPHEVRRRELLPNEPALRQQLSAPAVFCGVSAPPAQDVLSVGPNFVLVLSDSTQ